MKSITSVFLIWISIFSSLLLANGPISDQKLKVFKESLSEESIGNYDKAILLIKDLLRDENSDYLANLRLGWLNYLDKNFDESIKYYNEAVRLSDNSIEALLGLTYPYSGKNEWDKVEDIYAKILDFDEYNYTANMNLGKIYFNSGSYLNAKIYFENVYENYPSDANANLYLGWTYYYLGNKSKSRSFFTNTLIVDDDNSSAVEGLNLTR